MVGKRLRNSPSPSGSCSSPEAGRQSPRLDDTHAAKIAAFDRVQMPNDPIMQCSLPPHATFLEFSSLDAFEIHYAQEHTNRCSSCGKNFPSAHFLNLHLDESHNPLREALAARGEKTYACFLEHCDKKCSSPQKRRLHMIDKHAFPKLYDFRVIARGIDGTSSLLQDGRRRRVSVAVDPPSGHRRRTSIMNASRENASDVLPTPAAFVQDLHHKHGATESDSDSTPPAVGTSTLTHQGTPTEDSVRDLEASFAALRFAPRSIPSRPHSKAPQIPR